MPREIPHIQITNFSDLDKSRIDKATPENFNKVIWNSIVEYNYRAQLDHAGVLFEKYNDPKCDVSLKRNLVLRLFQVYMEALDQLGLVCRMVIDTSKPAYEIYVNSENPQTRSFFGQAIKGLSKNEIDKLLGLTFIKLDIISDQKDRERSAKNILEEGERLKSLLQQLGQSYTENKPETGKLDYTGAVKGSFAIKHGFKLIHPDELARSIWVLQESDIAVMQELADIQIQNEKRPHRLILTGMLTEGITEPRILENCIRNMEKISQLILWIANVQLWQTKDPYHIITAASEMNIVKIGRNDKCPCGSNNKFKQCHGL